jgi:hypothetical protein
MNTAPYHTDLMVPPESIDAFLEANPLPEEKKSWQYGHDLGYLKSLESLYKEYNSFAFSPFAQYKKHHIAKDLYDEKLKIITNDKGVITATAAVQTVKVASDILLYQDVKIARKQPMDVVVTKLQGISYEAIHELLETTKKSDTWVYVWVEDKQWHLILSQVGFNYIGAKITSFGEIYAIYFRDCIRPRGFELGMRKHPILDPVENISCELIGHPNKKKIEDIAKIISKLNVTFKNHYSNYNDKKSWSAISLRGYFPDPSRIEKPSEMNEKYHEEHSEETPTLQDTVIYDHFPMVREMFDYFFGIADIHRVRFMKLEPGGGELRRHTDLVDNDSGLTLGKLARFHFPIITNDDVMFTTWDLKGNEKTVNMKVGEYWLLDTRKPHKVVNNGSSPRIHLVVDVIVNKNLYDSLKLITNLGK